MQIYTKLRVLINEINSRLKDEKTSAKAKELSALMTEHFQAFCIKIARMDEEATRLPVLATINENDLICVLLKCMNLELAIFTQSLNERYKYISIINELKPEKVFLENLNCILQTEIDKKNNVVPIEVSTHLLTQLREAVLQLINKET